MSTQEIAQAFTALCKKGEFEQAGRRSHAAEIHPFGRTHY